MSIRRRPSRQRQVVFRFFATMGLIGLIGGIPLSLVEIHAPPPLSELRHLLVHPVQIQRVLTGRFGDGATSKLISSIAWLAWTWFIVCVGIEIVGRARGRVPGTVPASRHIQWMVKCLVGASLAVGFPSRHVSTLRLQVVAASASSPYNHPGEGATGIPSRGAPRVTARSVVPQTTIASSAPVVSERIYVVKPRDTLWSISEEELGTPLKWREIAAANYRRPQPDGGELTDDHWIRPGWLLVIPTPSVATTPPPSPKVPLMTTSASPAKIASPRPEIDNMPEGRAEPSSSAVGGPPRTHGSPVPHVPIVPIGYGILGAGIVVLLDRMRRAQRRKRPEGLRIALPEGDLMDLERGLRVSADPGSSEWVDLSLRLLSDSVRRGHLETPVVTGIVLHDDAVEIMLGTESPSPGPPPPFDLGPGGQSWILVKSGQRLEDLRKDVEIVGIDAPLPSLVTLGRDASGVVMVNLEAAGSVAVSGSEAELLLQAVAVELATATWSDQIDLVLVGFGETHKGLERVSHAGSLAVVAAKMKRRVRERAALLAAADRTSNIESRWWDSGDAWDLCVVVCSAKASDDEWRALQDLIEVVGDGSSGVATICGRDAISARWRVRADDGRVSIEGITHEQPVLSRQHVPPDFLESVAELVSVAAETSGVAPDEEPYAKLSMRIPERTFGPDEPTDDALPGRGTLNREKVVTDDADIVVKVLGQVEITGATRQFTRAWAIELVVYLAVHPGGVTNEQWATALWPDRTTAPASLHSTASAARRSLGTSASGDDHLPRARGRLALGPHVRTDWDTFVDLSRSSHPAVWREALELIVGRPFDGLRSPDWVVLEGILATVEAGIVDLACRYAHHCLESLDAGAAEWAARQGLRVSPYDERLYRVLLSASDVGGNPAGVESIMAELVHLVADDVEPFDAVHPETLALYRKLSRRSFASRGR